MMLTFLKSKLHQATVTAVNKDYEGSIAIDEDLMKESGILPFEQVDVYDITNGSRFTTYAIVANGGSGIIEVRGAAAHLVKKGDLIIIAAYVGLDPEEVAEHKPRTLVLDKNNKVKG